MQALGHDRLHMACGTWNGLSSTSAVNAGHKRQRSARVLASRRDVVKGIALVAAPWAAASDLLQPAAAIAAPPNTQLVPVTIEQKAALDKVLSKVVNKVKAPVLLRLAFHDAATYRLSDGQGGPNASVQFELDRPENTGLKRGWSSVVEVRKGLQGTVAETLSDSDIIALLGAYSVKVCKGPDIAVNVGRIDAVSGDPTGRLPSEKAPVSELKACFADAGLSTEEFVCLCGAHTLGTKGFGDPATFDNFYFNALLTKPWEDKSNSMADMIGLPSDRVLPDDAECRKYIQAYAKDQKLFLSDFSEAYAKLTSLGYA